MIRPILVIIITILGASSWAHGACVSPAGVAGQVQWIAADAKVKYCDGSNWKDTTQSEGGSCSGVTAGTINYSSGDLFYCNSSAKWIKMNSATNLGSCAGFSAGTINWDSGASKLRMCNGSSWYDLAAMEYNYIITLASNEMNVLLTSKLTALGWNGTSPVSILVTVNAGVTIGSTSTSIASFLTGALPAGSKLKIVNNGKIQGHGGAGADSNHECGGHCEGGAAGGPALEISLNMDLDNTNGNIWGGGGGGGGGAAFNCYGGAGGGGAGSLPGAGGYADDTWVLGNVGTETGGGLGGISYCGQGADGDGGKGGDPGEPGSMGQNLAGAWALATAGGAAGNAIKLNGKSINWLGGNSGTQVRGPVN